MEENDEEVKKTSKKGTIFNFILIITIFAGLLIYMINVDGIDNIINLLHQVNYNWVIAGLICLIIYWICEAITLHVPLKRMYKNQTFGNSGITFLQIIPAQAFLLLIMTFVPTPGSGLGAEGGFYLLFNSIFKKGTINMSILFWRIYTFYLPIIVGALFLIPIKAKKGKGD